MAMTVFSAGQLVYETAVEGEFVAYPVRLSGLSRFAAELNLYDLS
jgi:hypothetical protein